MNRILLSIGIICLLVIIIFIVYYIKIKRSMNLSNKFDKYTIKSNKR